MKEEETPKQAAIRGLKEELSITPLKFVEIPAPFTEKGEDMGYPEDTFRLFPFLCYPSSNSIKLNKENQKYGWKNLHEIDFKCCIPRLREHLESVYLLAGSGGVLPCEEGGIPKNMSKKLFRKYLNIRFELSKKYAN